MRFRLKVTFCMISLMTLLFSIGSCALISRSFQASLDREQTNATESYQLLLNTLQTVGSIQPWTSAAEFSDTLEQIIPQQGSRWAGVLLTCQGKTIYSTSSAASALAPPNLLPEDSQSVLTHLSDSQGKRYIQLSRAFSVGSDTVYLTAATDLTHLYDIRTRQQTTFYRIFAVMVVICTLLSYTTAYLLTRPLGRLSQAAREIAAGHWDYRVGLNTGDEIGLLARDFDSMAERVEASVEELQAAMERQEQFVGSFTHELKTPMTSIIGYADLLRSQSLSAEEQRDAVNYIFSEGRRLERLSLTLLNIFALEDGNLTRSPVSLQELITDLVVHLRPQYAQAGIQLHVRCPAGVCMLEGDLIRSLLLNLLDNARKSFDHGGDIWVEVQFTEDGCVLAVQDNGRGIPLDALNHLTEAFYRVDKSRSRRQGGAGLGLTLCAKIAALHDGSIRFDSTPSLGTTVLVTLKGDRL